MPNLFNISLIKSDEIEFALSFVLISRYSKRLWLSWYLEIKLLIIELPVVIYAIESIKETSFLVFELIKYIKDPIFESPIFFFKIQSPMTVKKYLLSVLVSKMVFKKLKTFWIVSDSGTDLNN